ncbi:MAG: zinc ribbon domain-containing protein [Clostridiales bacterium]|jgi:hypothetical protein|nr:zinc ribbon domain-containing protein [Clostridiales bacterium]
MECPKCGQIRADGEKFCSCCGETFSGAPKLTYYESLAEEIDEGEAETTVTKQDSQISRTADRTENEKYSVRDEFWYEDFVEQCARKHKAKINLIWFLALTVGGIVIGIIIGGIDFHRYEQILEYKPGIFVTLDLTAASIIFSILAYFGWGFWIYGIRIITKKYWGIAMKPVKAVVTHIGGNWLFWLILIVVVMYYFSFVAMVYIFIVIGFALCTGLYFLLQDITTLRERKIDGYTDMSDNYQIKQKRKKKFIIIQIAVPVGVVAAWLLLVSIAVVVQIKQQLGGF